MSKQANSDKPLITVTTFLWFDPEGRRNKQYVYTAESVNRLMRMVDRHLKMPHEKVCVTDMPKGLDPDIRIAPLDRSLLAPGTRYPKLQIFRADAARWLGERILFMDLDTVIVESIDSLVDRDEDIVLWANPRFGIERATRYNTSVILLRAGTRPEVWDDFGLAESYEKAKPRLAGTDQVWVSARLPDDEATWTDKDGIYWVRRIGGKLPKNARIVTFAGKDEPTRRETIAENPWLVGLNV